jgi:hypothetical protein
MNIENLSQAEIKTLHTLFGKLLEEPKQKVYLDPVNKYIDDIMENFNFERVHQTMEAFRMRHPKKHGLRHKQMVFVQ